MLLCCFSGAQPFSPRAHQVTTHIWMALTGRLTASGGGGGVKPQTVGLEHPFGAGLLPPFVWRPASHSEDVHDKGTTGRRRWSSYDVEGSSFHPLSCRRLGFQKHFRPCGMIWREESLDEKKKEAYPACHGRNKAILQAHASRAGLTASLTPDRGY